MRAPSSCGCWSSPRLLGWTHVRVGVAQLKVLDRLAQHRRLVVRDLEAKLVWHRDSVIAQDGWEALLDDRCCARTQSSLADDPLDNPVPGLLALVRRYRACDVRARTARRGGVVRGEAPYILRRKEVLVP